MNRSVAFAFLGGASLLIFYFIILTLVSGWSFTLIQFAQNWYWITGLSLGFGIQIGLFTYLRILHQKQVSGKVLAASGTTSGIAMIACCSHYLVNILPIIGISGFLAVIGQYQTELFLVGLVSNLAGIGYLTNKLIKIKRAA